jgi:two-component system response regulator RegX3
VRALVLRVEAILRRTCGDVDAERYIAVANKLLIDCLNLKTVNKAAAEIEFTRREIDLMKFLIKQGDKPTSRSELLCEVWGYKRASEIETRTVDIHIAKLRRKIEIDPKNPEYLVTYRGEGYKLLKSEFRASIA